VCITPPIGTPMSGYALREGPAIGIHDDLYARTLYLQDTKGEEFAIVVADVLGVDSDLYHEIVAEAKQKLGLNSKNLVVLGTHTHSGPALQAHWMGIEASILRRMFVKKVVGALAAAKRELTEVKVASGIGEAKGVVINRRRPRKGPIDTRVHVLAFYGGRSLKAVLSNYACHAVVLGANNRLISADYPGALNRIIESLTGAFSVFLNGTCGDINPLTPGTTIERVYDRSVGTFEDVEWMGKILACEVTKIALSLKSSASEVNLVNVCEEVDLKVKLPYSLSEAENMVREAEETIKRMKSASKQEYRKALLKLYYAKAILYKTRKYQKEKKLRVRVHGLALSRKAALVFLPSEVLVEIGLEIKRKSPFSNTIVASYANDYFGYIAPASEFPKGGYEVTYPTNILEPGEGDKLIELSTEVLKELLDA